MKSLLLGCGNNRQKLVSFDAVGHEWGELTTLDIDPAAKPDVVWDLSKVPLPFEDNTFDEIHAYEVLEHVGQQGDWRFFFAQFADFWRILKPGGHFVASCPKHDSVWAWADPGHTRVIAPQTLVYLSQKEYAAQVGKTHMTDYRAVYAADFDTKGAGDVDGSSWFFVLQAVK